jgi:hypothetical protein
VALAVLLWLSPRFTVLFWLVALALAATILAHLFYWVLVAPVNKVWLKGEALSAPASQFFGAAKDADHTDWRRLRDRWEWSHVCRAATSMIAFLLLLAVALGPFSDG